MNRAARMMLLNRGNRREHEEKEHEKHEHEYEMKDHSHHEKSEEQMPVHKLDEKTAMEWAAEMHNEDGTKGAHWTMEQVKQVMAQKGITDDPMEFWLTLNMMYSDYYAAAKKHNANTVDFYVDMARAFLEDKDAKPNKLARYYHAVVK